MSCSFSRVRGAVLTRACAPAEVILLAVPEFWAQRAVALAARATAAARKSVTRARDGSRAARTAQDLLRRISANAGVAR